MASNKRPTTSKRSKHPDAVAVKKRQFLLALKECVGHVRRACEKCGITYGSPYDWRRDEKFKADMDRTRAEAHEQFVDRLEEEIYNRAVDGVDEPVWHNGVQVGTVKRLSDRLLIELMKAENPAKWRDKSPPQLVVGAVPLAADGLFTALRERARLNEQN